MANFNPIGAAVISVADIAFFDVLYGKEIGQAIALTESSIESTMSNNEIRGGYLNELLFNVMHSRTFGVTATSATFKNIFLAMQAGNQIQSSYSADKYVFQECQTATNGDITLDNQPIGFVHCILPSGATTDVQATASSKSINVGAGISGTVKCSYFFANVGERITIDTNTQPMVVKAVMKIHAKEQDGTQKTIQVTIPLLQLSGEITFSLTADGVATQSINGSALAYSSECGQNKYADWDVFVESGITEVLPQTIVAQPSKYTLTAGKTATANIIAVMPGMYANIPLTNGGALTFVSSTPANATVVAQTGVITAVKTGSAVITATYTPVTGTSYTCDITVTVS